MATFHPEDIPMMERAIIQAKRALDKGEFPVGAIIVRGGEIIGEGTRISSSGDAVNELDHAEIMAIRAVYEKVHAWPGRLGPLTCYVTLEPCLMCLGALLINGVKRVVFGFEDVMGGACGIDFKKRLCWRHTDIDEAGLELGYIYKDIEVVGGVLRQKCLYLFKEFYSRPESSYLQGTLLREYVLNLMPQQPDTKSPDTS